ncbi:hypothetical protein LCL87_12415 [Rhodococcus hoagii]|nr:hypothetical protein [Prescottella equi]
MITRGRGRRAHLVVGDPWLDAAAGFLGFGSPDEEPWRLGDGIRTGDLVVTVLDTDPRLLLCVERVDAIEDDGIAVGERWTTSGFPPVDAVEQWAGVALPTCPGPLPHAVADVLLALIDEHPGLQLPAPPGSAADAQLLLTLRSPECDGCHGVLHLGDPISRRRVHLHAAPFFSEPGARPDWSTVLCASCVEEMTAAGFTNYVDYRFSLHPPCPNCAAHTTAMMCMGFPPDPGPRGFAPWVSMGGCCVGPDTPSWTCGTCHHSW